MFKRKFIKVRRHVHLLAAATCDPQELEDEQNYQRTVGEGLGLIG